MDFIIIIIIIKNTIYFTNIYNCKNRIYFKNIYNYEIEFILQIYTIYFFYTKIYKIQLKNTYTKQFIHFTFTLVNI